MKKILFLLPLLCILLCQCSVQKRKYQKGFHISWKSSLKNSTELKKAGDVKHLAFVEGSNNKTSLNPTAYTSEEVVQTFANNKTTISELKIAKKQLIGDEPCDDLIFKDGTEIKGKVTEITETEIKYKKCDMLEGPIYVARKSDLFMIKYANGTREVFKTESAASPRPLEGKQNYPLKTHPLAVASLVLGILSIIPYLTIPAAILAIVFGNTAKRRIAAQPNYYKGDGIATAGKTIGIVMLSIIAAIILLFIIALVLLI